MTHVNEWSIFVYVYAPLDMSMNGCTGWIPFLSHRLVYHEIQAEVHLPDAV